MTTPALESNALWWLRINRRLPVALFQRSPRYNMGLPDALGITRAGYMVEVEIKRSIGDFRANGNKRHISKRQEDFLLGNPSPLFPKEFWYLVPSQLVEQVKEIVPPWAGLLTERTGNYVGCRHIKEAPINHASKKLSVKEKYRLFFCMANQVFSLCRHKAGQHDEDYQI